MAGERVRIAPEVRARAAEEGDVFEVFPPPFDLASDMLLAGATCPVAPLRDAFPDVPFVAVGGRAVLGIWFTRVLEARVGPGGERRLGPEEAPEDFPYGELNVAVLLRGRRVFVPGIYATSELTLRIGHRYGMPKRRVPMEYRADGRGVRSRAQVGGAESCVRARALTSGRVLGALVARAFPWWSPPVLFPGGSRIEGLLERADHARLLWVQEGRLELDEAWLPRPVPLGRLALHLPTQRMKLPAPRREGVGKGADGAGRDRTPEGGR